MNQAPIRFGGAGPKAKEQAEQDVTVVSVDVRTSTKFTELRKDGTKVPKTEMLVSMRRDDGVVFIEYLGGVYPNADGTVGFGKGGKAAEFIQRWQEATGRTANDVSDLVKSRFHGCIVRETRGGFNSAKFLPTGPARSAEPANLPPVAPPIPRPAMAAPPVSTGSAASSLAAALAQRAAPIAPPAPAALDGKSLFDAISDASAKPGIIDAAKQMSAAELVSILRTSGVGVPAGHAEAIVAYASTQ